MYAIFSCLLINSFDFLSIGFRVFITSLLALSAGFLVLGNGLLLFSFMYCSLAVALISSLRSTGSMLQSVFIRFLFLPAVLFSISIEPFSMAIACTSTPSAAMNDSSVNSGVVSLNLIPSA